MGFGKILRFLKRKKEKPSPFDIVKKQLLTELGEDTQPYIFNYDLSYTNEKVVGVCALFEGKLYFKEENRETKTLSLDEFQEIYFVNNWGCVSVEGKTESGEIEICRCTMKLSDQLRYAVKELDSAVKKSEKTVETNDGKPKSDNPRGKKPPQKGGYKLFARLIPYAKPQLKPLLLAALCLLVISASNLILPFFNKAIVDDYLTVYPFPEDKSGFFWLVGGMALFGFIIAISNAFKRYLVSLASKNLLIKVREDIYGKIQRLSLSALNKQSAGELIQRVTRDADELREFITWVIPDIIQHAITLSAVAVVMFIINWKLTLLVVVPVPFLVILFRVIHRFTHKGYRRQWNVESDAGTLMHDVFSGMRVVKTYGTEKREEERFAESAKRIADISRRNELVWNMTIPFASFLLSFGEFAVLYFLGCELVGDPSFITSGNPNFTLGDLSQFLSFVAIIYQPIRWMAFVPRRISRAATSLSKISELLDEEDEVLRDGEIIETINGDIEFKNLSFGYNDAEYVLKNINLKINKGEMVGFVGRSGVGKTTAANLILRLYDAGEGALTIDGKDLKDIEPHSYRSQIGVVLQETFLFNGTIYSNIAYAKPGATRDEVIRAAKLANAHEFIMKQPDGYNTYVGDRGNTLSGGEKQRIAIARAILRNPRILILDEATSSLDTETEKQIQEAIAKLSGGRTTVAIAHRLSTLRNATKIVVFEKGQIEEIGSHDELMRKKGRYYRLVMAQRQVNKM